MSSTAPEPVSTTTPAAFAVERWSASSGSSRPSRADLVIDGGGRKWRAHATGNGAVDALLRSVDLALAPVLGGGVELQTYNVHATGDGHDAAASVTLSLRAQSGDPRAPAYAGRGVHENVLEASLVAYVDAINKLVAHANGVVAAAAPAPQGTPMPRRAEDSDTSQRHREYFMEMFNR